MEFEPFVITFIIVMCFSGMIGTFIGVCLRLAWRAWLSRPKPLPIVGQEVVLELTPDGRYPPRREVKRSAEPAWTGCDQEEGFSMGTCLRASKAKEERSSSSDKAMHLICLMFTLSPGTIRMKFFRILPATCALTM
jgi:hypothetical protein